MTDIVTTALTVLSVALILAAVMVDIIDREPLIEQPAELLFPDDFCIQEAELIVGQYLHRLDKQVWGTYDD